MDKRFYRMGNAMFGACVLLSLSSVAVSCTDNYPLDNTTPAFLGGSIYQTLTDKGNFKYTLRLIDDLQYAEVMGKTGSKTLFAAPDSAFETFFKNNSWGVRSYEQLTEAQKRILFNSTQLNNAYVLEMMANSEGGQKNLNLRQVNSMAATDSVPFWHWNQLPVNYSQDPNEIKYWDRFRNNQKSILMATDATSQYMMHFLEAHMKQVLIKKDDVSFVLNETQPWLESESRSYIYNAKVTEQDIVCQNGYIHLLDKVLVQPSTMAEEIRKEPSTQIFSHILDRFSGPYYNATLTTNYNATATTQVDSIFERRYFAVNTQSGRLTLDPDRKGFVGDFPYLNFDPGWSAYAASVTESADKNMAAMFVPSDAAMKEYFITGGGRILMDRYAVQRPVTEDNLLYNIDQIPLTIIQAMVNNLMKASFNESVPSKYLTIMNDARDQMFPPTEDAYASLENYKKNFSKTLLANNGVVYIMNRVISPADYASVIAPALFANNTQVVRTVVRADDSFIQGSSYALAPLKQYFSTYLKAMQSRFSFFIPTDEGLNSYGYIDPVQLGTGNERNYQYWRFEPKKSKWADSNPRLAVDAKAFRYSLARGQQPTTDVPYTPARTSENAQILASEWGEVKKALLIEMIDQHIVVHDNNDKVGVRGDRKYFLSRSGAPVVVKNNVAGVGMEVNGGLQEQLQNTPAAYTSTVTEEYDHTVESNGYGNGYAYLIDRPMQPAVQSTHDIVSTRPGNVLFYNLCTGMTEALLQKAGYRDEFIEKNNDPQNVEWKKLVDRYFIFMNTGTNRGSYTTYSRNKLVRFFNNFRYTVYLPTNAAVEQEIAAGLPTWESIDKFLDDNLVSEPALEADNSNQDQVNEAKAKNKDTKVKAQAMITLLVNFLRYHFQDESVFVDNVNNGEVNYTTAAVNAETGTYMPLYVTQTNGNITVKDEAGRTAHVSATDNNILVRDAILNGAPAESYFRTIKSSSYAVIHEIDKALRFDKLVTPTQGYAAVWATPAKAKRFVAKYGIKE